MESPKEFESIEAPGRNLLEDFDGVVSAIAQIEGPGWEARNRSVINEHTALGIFDWLKKQAPDTLEDIGNQFIATIYGGGGINRWMVNGRGEVRFSSSHKRDPKSLEQAQALGFELI